MPLRQRRKAAHVTDKNNDDINWAEFSCIIRTDMTNTSDQTERESWLGRGRRNPRLCRVQNRGQEEEEERYCIKEPFECHSVIDTAEWFH